MLTRRVLCILTFAGTLLLAAGCGGGGSGSPSFTVKNDTGEAIKYLAIMDAGPVLNYAKLDNRESMTRGYKSDEMPRTITVHWEDYNGKHHQARVELWKHLPGSYVGPVKLTVDRHLKIRVRRA